MNLIIIWGVDEVVKKIRLVGARKYIQGYPPWQPKVRDYPIEFDGDDAVMPLEKYEGDKKLRESFRNFKCVVFEE